MNKSQLEEMAVKELLKEAERGKERYQTMGPRGWQKDIIPTANKRFLQRTIASTLPRRTENLQKKKRINTKSPTNHSKCGEVSEKPKPNEKTIDSKTTFKTKKVDKKRKLSAHSYVSNKKKE